MLFVGRRRAQVHVCKRFQTGGEVGIVGVRLVGELENFLRFVNDCTGVPQLRTLISSW